MSRRAWAIGTLLALVSAPLCALVVSAGPAAATTFGPVDPTIPDGNANSLRDILVNQVVSGDTVLLQPGATYTLTSCGGGPAGDIQVKAAVTINSVTSLLTSFGTGDIDSVWGEGDYGWPWEREAFYRERSPLTHAAQIITPLRIIAAENDYRCPISQSEELYTWLKVLGQVPVDFVRMPGASHGVHATPRQRIRALDLEHEWILRYCPA